MEGSSQPSVRKAPHPGQKVVSTQRPRTTRTDDEARKRPAVCDELEQMKNLHTLMEVLNKTVDPFTTDEIEIALSQVAKLTGGQLSAEDCQDLFRDFVLDPNKNKKSSSHAEITESKKRYDLVWNKDGCDEDALASRRFELYHQHMPLSSSTNDILAFLKKLYSNPPTSPLERKQALRRARQLADTEVTPVPSLSHDVLQQLTLQVRDVELQHCDFPSGSRSLAQAVRSTQLTASEKLTLLKGIQKHCWDWEKICKEFKDQAISKEYLKHQWRLLKAVMREEVGELKQRTGSFDYVRWVRAAIRKLENQTGKKTKSRHSELVDATQSVQRVDNLTILAMVGCPEPFDPVGACAQLPSCSSHFKVYEKHTEVPPRPKQCYRPFSLALVDEIE